MVEERDLATFLPRNPWEPAPFDRADMAAIKALRDGTATPDQQQRALGFILFMSGYRINQYRPGSARDSDFASGLAWVGNQIETILALRMPSHSDTEQGT